MKNIKIQKHRSWLQLSILIGGFLLICLPLYASNALLDYLKLFGTDINIFHIIFIIATFFVLIQQKTIMKSKIIIAIILFYGIVVFQMLNGFSNGEMKSYILKDINMYIFPIFITYTFAWYFYKNKYNIYDLMSLLLKGVTTCCVINIIMYLTSFISFWGISTYAGGRFGGSYLSSIVLVSCYATYAWIYKLENKKILLIYFLTAFISLVLSQSRSIFISTLLIVYITIFFDIKRFGKIQKNKTLKLIAITVLFFCISIFFINSDSNIMNRISSFSNLKQDSSFLVRLNLYRQNFYIFKENINGLGLGAMMPIYDGFNNLFQYSNFIDNSYLTIGVKLGIVALIMYIYIIVLYPLKILKKHYKDKFKNIFIVAYILFLFNVSFITAQSITSLSVSTIIWLIVSYSISFEKINIKKIIK